MIDPHAGAQVRTAGAPLAGAPGVLVLQHGRGGTPEDMLGLAAVLGLPELACLAPGAIGHTWYPFPFLAPVPQNEPWFSSALRAVDRTVQHALHAGLPPRRVALLGFSQGACLTLEYAARHPRGYGAVIGLTGGLLGPPGTPWPRPVGLDGVPVFLSTSDIDPHVPLVRVRETARVFKAAGAEVTLRVHPGAPHTVVASDVKEIGALLRARLGAPDTTG